MKVTVEIKSLTADDVRVDEIVLLLRDALSDFCRARNSQIHAAPSATWQNAQQYVEERYDNQSPAFRSRKVDEVRRRLSLAAVISIAVSDMEVE